MICSPASGLLGSTPGRRLIRGSQCHQSISCCAHTAAAGWPPARKGLPHAAPPGAVASSLSLSVQAAPAPASSSAVAPPAGLMPAAAACCCQPAPQPLSCVLGPPSSGCAGPAAAATALPRAPSSPCCCWFGCAAARPSRWQCQQPGASQPGTAASTGGGALARRSRR